jgi:ribosomal protein L13E
MWVRSDWREFFRIADRRWYKFRPPRPVDLSSRGRVSPTEGFSMRELDDAGISLEQAQTFGLPVDCGRVSAYGPNVSALRDFARAARGSG